MTERPNIVVIMTDDQTVESMRVMEQTRSMLGEHGTTFVNSFVNYPLCCPSRSTFLTGQYSHNHDVLSNKAPYGGFERFQAKRGANNLVTWLRDAGYHTAHVGKYLNGYGASDPNLVPPGWAEWYATIPPNHSAYDYPLNENGTVVHYGHAEQDFKQDVLTRKAIELINRHARSPQPLFLSLAYTAPHRAPDPIPHQPADCRGTAKPAPRHADAFDAEPLPRPPSFNEDDASDKPPKIRALPRLDAAEVDDVQRKYRCRLEALLSVDDGVAAIVGALSAGGEIDRTLIVFTSDHGFFHGEHRIRSGKSRHYEESTRVPLIIRGPGVAAGKEVPELVVNADLAPTILDAAGAAAGLEPDGVSLLPIASDGSADLRRDLLIEHQTYTAIRTDRYVYVEHSAGKDAGARELYDLDADPCELHSLHGDPAHQDVRAGLADRLSALRICAGTTCRARPDSQAS